MNGNEKAAVVALMKGGKYISCSEFIFFIIHNDDLRHLLIASHTIEMYCYCLPPPPPPCMFVCVCMRAHASKSQGPPHPPDCVPLSCLRTPIALLNTAILALYCIMLFFCLFFLLSVVQVALPIKILCTVVLFSRPHYYNALCWWYCV